MPTVTTKIVISEKEILELVQEKYNIDSKNSKVTFEKFDGDQREPSYVKLIVSTTTYV